MGNGTQANLNKLGVEVRDLSSLLITHHHLDHNEEFVPMFIRTLLGRNDFTIIGPPNTSTLTKANLEMYAEDIAYRLSKTQRTIADRKESFEVTDIKGGESFKVGNIKVSTLEVPHTIHTIAYRFDLNEQSIVVTGDLTYSEDLPKLASGADIMIIDSGGMIMNNGKSQNRQANSSSETPRSENSSKNSGSEKNQGNARSSRTRAHLDLDDSSTLAHKSNVATLVYTHFNAGDVDTESSL
jgi:ribonuclease BN (tRNA processing enzyme)